MRWFAVVAFAGCSGPTTTPDDDAPVDTDTTTTSGDTSTTDTDTVPVTTEPQALHGTLENPSGGPLAGWSVKFCNVVGCRVTTTDTFGAFDYLDVTLDAYSLEPVPPEGSGYATMNLPFTFDANEVKTLGLTEQELEDTTLIAPAPVEIELGSDLWVTIGSGDLKPPDAFHPAASTAGGVRVPEAQWPPIDDVTGTVLGVWYTHPFDYVAEDGLPVRIADDLGLGEGETVHLLIGSYSAFAWVDAGTLTVTGGELVGVTELPLLSTILAVQQ